MVEVGEECAHAGLGLRLVVEDADFAAVERRGVENGDGREDGVGAVPGDANSKRAIVAGVQKQKQGGERQKNKNGEITAEHAKVSMSPGVVHGYER